MAEENPQEPTQQEPENPPAEPTPKPAADPKSAEPAPKAPAPGSTVNRAKHERDMAKLQDQLDAKEEELKGYKGLKEEFEQWKADQEAEKINSALKAAGCHNLKAAAACLDDFDGDIEKLKEEMPYLFTSTDKSKSTGGKQKGSPNPEDERTKRYRDIFGLSEKE